MPQSIDIDDEIFELLKNNAEPLVDTPSSVLRRLLGLDANGATPAPAPPKGDASKRRRRRSKRTGRGRKSSTTGGQRAARGTLLPEPEYELPILRYLDQHDGRAPSREVVEAIGEELADKLTAADRETLRSGDVRWVSRAAFVRLRLVERGDMDPQAPRGTWQITDQGRERLRAENQPSPDLKDAQK